MVVLHAENNCVAGRKCYMMGGKHVEIETNKKRLWDNFMQKLFNGSKEEHMHEVEN